MKSDMYFAGEIESRLPGFFLYASPVDRAHSKWLTFPEMPEDFPFHPYMLDGCLLGLPYQEHREGEGTVLTFRGWTVLSFWDRSVNPDSESCSCFIMRGKYSFAESVERARESFPEIWSRFSFTVTEKPLLTK